MTEANHHRTVNILSIDAAIILWSLTLRVTLTLSMFLSFRLSGPTQVQVGLYANDLRLNEKDSVRIAKDFLFFLCQKTSHEVFCWCAIAAWPCTLGVALVGFLRSINSFFCLQYIDYGDDHVLSNGLDRWTYQGSRKGRIRREGQNEDWTCSARKSQSLWALRITKCALFTPGRKR